MSTSLLSMAVRLERIALRIEAKKPKKHKENLCRYTRDTSGNWKWVCGPGGTPPSQTTAPTPGPGGGTVSPGGVGDGGGSGAAGGAAGGDGGGGAGGGGGGA